MIFGVTKKSNSSGRRRNRAVLEQVAEHRKIAEQRDLRHVDRVLRLDHATDHHGSSIIHQNGSRRLLRD